MKWTPPSFSPVIQQVQHRVNIPCTRIQAVRTVGLIVRLAEAITGGVCLQLQPSGIPEPRIGLAAEPTRTPALARAACLHWTTGTVGPVHSMPHRVLHFVLCTRVSQTHHEEWAVHSQLGLGSWMMGFQAGFVMNKEYICRVR
jgi:hypothetical protein